MLKDLHPDLLYVIVFGPGFGESIVLRIPPSHWVVIDGLITDDVSPAAELLSQLGVEWSGIVLTHDHEDHAPGLANVLSMKGKGPIGCAMPFILNARDQRETADGKTLFDSGITEDTLAKIDQRWLDDSTCEWRLAPGVVRKIGGAELKALWPDTALLPAYRTGMQNRFSTPLQVTWNQLRLLLGADLPTKEWIDVGSAFKDLGDHSLFKIAHHGSKGSVSNVYTPKNPQKQNIWIATPFTKSHIPRFGDNEGIDLLLKSVSELHLTSLPYASPNSAKYPLEMTRSALHVAKPPASAVNPQLNLIKRPKCLREQVLTHCVIAAGFNAEGARVDVRHGQGTVIVRK